jgi:hexulose-6-phosphate isomerase
MEEKGMGRRAFLKYSAAVSVGAGVLSATLGANAAESGAVLKKALQFGMLPKGLSNAEKFKLAKACGFEGIETGPMDDLKAAEELGKASRDAGTPIHSIVFGGWDASFSDPDPKVVEKGRAGMDKALRSAKAMGASAVLLVPALVTETVRYREAYERSQEQIRTLLPLAAELGVIIAVENVWNKFLLSPVEFARYVDEFESPWLRAYFDVGNNIIFGYSQDWIRELGGRIAKIHLKDFKRDNYQWTNLGDGDVNWAEVRRALDEIGYSGFLTPELGGGDEAYLRDLSARIDKLLAKR